jgi:hypothetical protein
MPRHNKTTLSPMACNCTKPCLACCCSPTDQVPRMGSALRSFLKRYARELQPYAEATGDRVAGSMVDCCNLLLTESDNLERWQP